MCGTNTGTTMLDRLVRNGKFTKVVASHLRLDLNRVEHLPVVYPNNGPNHLRDDDHITKMGLYNSRLLIRRRLLLGFSELFYETHWFTFQTALEPSTSAGMNELYKLLIFHV